MSDAQIEELIPGGVQSALIRTGALREDPSANDLRRLLVRMNADFRDKAPVTAAAAASVILDGVRSGAWRILVGDDAAMIDEAVRAKPYAAYECPIGVDPNHTSGGHAASALTRTYVGLGGGKCL